ncbi:helix-turn-helix domain-containing protein [Shewanella oncorhynchi]|uniref:helix-turn-helix domain-containing protein n=1 Tax=Shewanella TaxID=22 RepID=UPI0021DB44EE|nr:helix-turn-helix domain-containing protein [Shewanella sp. SM23]MCU8083632.1 helix-turn-helix domain-containing protein [Shewanella sp. SM23]
MHALKGSRANVVFFILLWNRHFGYSNPISRTVAEIAKQFSVSKTVVSEALTYLVERGFFEKERSSTLPKRGRPTYQYIVSRQLQDLLRLMGTSSQYQPLVNELLTLDQKYVLHTNLKLNNRLLLCVLLLHADPTGVVRNLDVKTITNLAGISRDQFRNQLQKLKNLGYIQAIIPGTSSRYLFTHANSAYFLDFSLFSAKHTILEELAPGYQLPFLQEINVVSLLNFANQCQEWLLKHLKNQQLLKHLEDGNIPEEKVPNEFYKFAGFVGHRPAYQGCVYFQSADMSRLSVLNVMQGRLNYYASFLLSNHWCDLLSEQAPPAYVELKNMIIRDFDAVVDASDTEKLKLKKLIYNDDFMALIPYQCKEVFYEIMYHFSIELARYCIRELSKHEELKDYLGSLYFSIFPFKFVGLGAQTSVNKVKVYRQNRGGTGVTVDS